MEFSSGIDSDKHTQTIVAKHNTKININLLFFLLILQTSNSVGVQLLLMHICREASIFQPRWQFFNAIVETELN
jgi:hypothetical protein